jgi:hypothetical protein
MPSHEERALEIVEFDDALLALHDDQIDRLQKTIAQALAEVEREAYERAAKVAETEAEFRGEGDGEIWIASKIAQSIRSLSRNED